MYALYQYLSSSRQPKRGSTDIAHLIEKPVAHEGLAGCPAHRQDIIICQSRISYPPIYVVRGLTAIGV
jgi:hypothetical protein